MGKCFPHAPRSATVSYEDKWSMLSTAYLDTFSTNTLVGEKYYASNHDMMFHILTVHILPAHQ